MATKAKTKTQTKTQTKTRGKSGPSRVSLPEGYEVIERPPNWECEEHPIIEGIRGETNELTLDKGREDERDIRNCVVVDKTLGPVTVWESGRLIQFFDETEDGDEVYIEYLGLGPIKRSGDSPPKLFRCAKKPKRASSKKERNPF